MAEEHAERPALEYYSDVPLLNMKAMVQQTGIAAPTLRAWERRYAILAPQRTHHAYRLYSERDVAIIRWLKERVDAGLSISQAVALLRHLEEEHNRLHSTSRPATPSAQQANAAEIASHAPATYNMRLAQDRLLAAFKAFDETAASRVMTSMLAIYPIEQICAELITPTLWEIGRLWEQEQITVSVEHFASNFFHSLLTNLSHTMPVNSAYPLVIACCAPGELHELGLLMLSLLLRRSGLRVAYLGQNIETAGLLQTIMQLSPAAICVSVTMPEYLEATIKLGQQMQEISPARPCLIFGGQAFKQHPDAIAQIPGVYLSGEMQRIVTQIRQMAFQQGTHHV